MDYKDAKKVNAELKKAQDADFDQREIAREDIHFLHKEDGQWEPEVISRMTNRPRYTFDQCNPVVDSIAGEIEQAEFGIRVRPAGGEATEDVAEVMNGMIRNIQNISNASSLVFNPAARKMVESGFSAWRVTTEWADTDSFEQDLFIRPISNAIDRVWFDTAAERQDMSDARWAVVLHPLTKEEYEKRFPDGRMDSVGQRTTSDVYYYKPDFIIVGELIYKEPVTKEMVLMNDGSVYEDNEDFQKVVEELKQKGVTEERRSKRKSHKVMTRYFDGQDWLDEAKETPFSYIPVIPIFANFSISENKIIYRGAISKLKDAQRVYNYAQSRAIEEGALAPRVKYWMTKEQATGHEKQLSTMNTNADPVQFYNHVDGQPAPGQKGGAQITPGLQQTAQDMAQNIINGSGIFAANQGDAPNQSGYAIELQQNKGDNSTIKYFKSVEIGITQTARVLIDAIPKIYDTRRTVRILGEDGQTSMETLNDRVLDEQTGELVQLNDVRAGRYDVVCDVGPAFKNRQQETQRAFLEMAQISPEILQMGADILLNNTQAPGMSAMAERMRKQLFQNGLIPDSQMTDEEKQKAQQMIAQAQAEQQQGPSVMDQAIIAQTQAQTADTQSKAEERQANIIHDQQKYQLDVARFEQKSQQDQMKMMLEQQKQQADTLRSLVESMKGIREAMGADAVVSPQAAETFSEQAEIVNDAQEGMS